MLYELLLRQRLYDQQVINRFHYLMTGTPATVLGSFGLMFAAGCIPEGVPPAYPTNTLFSELRDMQSSDVYYEEVVASALYDVTDFYLRPFPTDVQGTYSAPASSPVLAYGFTGSRVRSDIRRGQKRVAGVVEALIGDGGEVVGTGVTQGALLAAEIGATITYDDEGNTLTYTPVTLSFEEYVTPAGNTAYRKYETLLEQMEHYAAGAEWVMKPFVRTQNSRQYGHGR